MKYTFTGEFGKKTLTYPQYLRDKEMMRLMNDPGRKIVHCGTDILTYDPQWLAEHEAENDMVRMLDDIRTENPLRFFVPSSLKTTGTIDFLNDRENDVKLLLAGNRRGKTASGVIDILLDVIPTSPDWEIFTKHGVKWRPFNPPENGFQIGFATTEWSVCQRVLWPELKKWIPKYELGDYDPRLKKARDIAWRQNPDIKLVCGTHIYFFCYKQEQGPFEGQALDRWYWDEQGEEAKFDGADERLRTRKGRHVFGLTPHKVEGREDTGARSWIHSMITGDVSKGHDVAQYNIGVDDVPDWVYPESEKKKAYEKWILAPIREKNKKNEKEGRSRYYGEWHDVAGLVYDEWDEKYHLIDPFDIPDEWTRYRGLDHGITNPTAMLCAAVSEDGDIYLYQEYYRSGLTIYENVHNIVKLCGNKLVMQGKVNDRRRGMYYERFAEEMWMQVFHSTVLDSRSKAMRDPASGMTVGEMYKRAGLRTKSASGAKIEEGVSLVKQFLWIDPNKSHPRNDVQGSPRIFVFRNLTNFIREIKGYAMQDFKSSKAANAANIKETPVRKNDHLMDVLRYLIQDKLRYIPGRWAHAHNDPRTMTEEEKEDNAEKKKARRKDSFTAY